MLCQHYECCQFLVTIVELHFTVRLSHAVLWFTAQWLVIIYFSFIQRLYIITKLFFNTSHWIESHAMRALFWKLYCVYHFSEILNDIHLCFRPIRFSIRNYWHTNSLINVNIIIIVLANTKCLRNIVHSKLLQYYYVLRDYRKVTF